VKADTARIRAIVSLFDRLGLDASAVENLENFEEWITTLSELELCAMIELLSRRLVKRLEKE
jgi:hypothetical protein